VLAGAIEGAILRGIEEGSAAAAAAAGGGSAEAQAEDAWLSLYAVFKTVFGQDMPDLGSSFVHQARACPAGHSSRTAPPVAGFQTLLASGHRCGVLAGRLPLLCFSGHNPPPPPSLWCRCLR
jgi:hypothetical protein